MDFTALQRALDPRGSTVTVTTNTFPAPFGDFLERCYFAQGRQIVIDDAAITSDEPSRSVTVTGRASILLTANARVAARFSLDEQGVVQAALTYTMLAAGGSSQTWKFSNLLPDLPGEVSPRLAAAARSTGLLPAEALAQGVIEADQPALLDTLSFLDARVVVTNGAYTPPDADVALADEGIWFVGKLRPASLIGALGATLAPATTVTAHGRIAALADPTRWVLPAAQRDLTRAVMYPWEYDPALPGVHLEAPLGLDFTAGKLTLRDAALRIYSPLSASFLASDERFQPSVAVTGSFAVPSADIEIDAIAQLEGGLPRVTTPGATTNQDILVETRPRGLTIGNLAKMTDVLGAGGDPLSSLPKPLARAVQGLEQIGLTDVAARLSAGTSGLNASWASVSIGTPGVRWKVWGDHLEVTDIGVRFDVTDPLGTSGGRSTDVSLWGVMDVEGAVLVVSASTAGDGYVLSAALRDATIPLGGLMKTFAPRLPAPGNFAIDRLLVSLTTGESFQLAGALAGEPNPWELPVGPGKLKIEDVAFDFTVPQGGGDTTGSFRGDIEFNDDVKLSMAYTLPGDFVVRGEFDKISLRGLIAKLSNQKLWLPKGFDITLLDSIVLIERGAGGTGAAGAAGAVSARAGSPGGDSALIFQLATQVEGMGMFAFEARQISASAWGFAAGFDLGAAKPSSIPGLSALAKFERMLGLDKLMLVVSSFDAVNFQFPDAAKFQNPRLGTDKLALPGHAGGLTAGLNVFAEWKIDTEDKTQHMLAKLLGLDPTIAVTLQLSEHEARVFFRYDTRLMGHPMFCECGVMATGGLGGELSWFLTGSVTVNIQKHPQTFDIDMVVVPTGILLSGTMRGDASVKVGPFALARLAIEVGVDVAGIPSLGVTGTIDAADFESSIALFFDATDPARSMVAGSVSDLTLGDVIKAFLPPAKTRQQDEDAAAIEAALNNVAVKGTGAFSIPASAVKRLDGRDYGAIARAFRSGGKVKIPSTADQLLFVVDQPGKKWFLTDLTNMRHYQLVRRKRRGAADTVEVSLEAQLYFAPADTSIGTIRFPAGFFVNGAIDVFGFHAQVTVNVSAGPGTRGIAADAQMDKIVIGNEQLLSIKAARGRGGPRISFATYAQPQHEVPEFRPPHFYVNGKLTLLGISQSVFVSLTTKGFEFELKGKLARAAEFDLTGRFGGPSNLSAGGAVKVGVGTIDLGPLGKVKIDTDVEGAVAIAVSRNKITATVAASFEALGKKHKIAKLSLDTSTAALSVLAKTLEHEVEKELRAFFKDAQKWAHAVEKGLVTGVEDTEQVLRKVFKKPAAEARQIANKARKAAGKEIAKDTRQVKKAMNKAGKNMGKGMNKAGKNMGKGMNKAGKNMGKGMNKAGKNMGKGMNKAGKDIGKALGGLFKKRRRKKR